ncbi:MAG: flagellar hook-length control protein FliK [Gammaproteobacteria bacterium]
MRLDLAPLALGNAARASALLKAWATDQLLAVTVIGKVRQNLFLVDVGGQSVEAHSTASLQPGDQFQVRLTSAGSQPILTRVDAATRDVTAPVLAAAITRTLPTQQPLAVGIEMIDQIARGLPTETGGVNAHRLITTVRAFLANPPTLPTLANPARLAQAIDHCGIHLEAALKAAAVIPGTPFPTHDLKWQAIKLACALPATPTPQPATANGDWPRPLRASAETPISPAEMAGAKRRPSAATAPTELPRYPGKYPVIGAGASAPTAPPTDLSDPTSIQTALQRVSAHLSGVIAGITTRQVQTIEALATEVVYGNFELPVAIDGRLTALEIEIERELCATSVTEDPATDVLVRIPLSESAELRARLRLGAGGLSVTLWSDEANLRDAISEHASALGARLCACGFKLQDMQIAVIRGRDSTRHLASQFLSVEA